MGLEVDNNMLTVKSKAVKQTETKSISDNSISIFSLDNIKEHKTELAIAGGILTAGLIGLSLFTKKNIPRNIPSINKNEILKLDLNASIKPEKLLGEGAEGAVYRISDSNYVLKVPHIKKGKEIDVSKLDFNVREQDRINHIVARCGDAKIMDYIHGIPSSHAPANIIENLTSANIKNFFLDIVYANKNKMRLDWMMGNNCIINPENGKLIIFDLNPGRGYQRKLLTIFSTLIAENCNLTATQQNSILKKGVISLLELFRDKKINIKKYHKYLGNEFNDSIGLKDAKFVSQLKEILCQYSDSKISINDCIEKVQKIDLTP